MDDRRPDELGDQFVLDLTRDTKSEPTNPPDEGSRPESSEAQESLDQDQDALDRQQTNLDREQAHLERSTDEDEFEVHRDQRGIDRDQAVLDRRQARLDRAQAALDRESGVRKDYLIDELTGILRRGPGMRELQHEMDRARRQGLSLVVAFIDVDGLKAVNDRQGHAAGDQVLRTVAQALRQGLRSYDLLFRYGGDEFVCALSEANMDHARGRLREVAYALAAATSQASIAWGLAELEENDDIDDLVGRADSALYEARDVPAKTPDTRSN
ncbi:MAG TPA: diguanylate cyclase [Actinomycetota bacterium]|nr:diguanylate cyclase [Actinomycetota bacterium]